MTTITIILIEDDPLFALEVEMLIRKMEYASFKVLNNSDTALLEIQKSPPDVLLLDILIEGSMTGIELAKKLRALQINIPIIFLTANMDEETYVQARETEPAAYLVKPFNMLTLRSAIETVLLPENSDATSGADGTTKTEVIQDDFFYIKQSRKVHKVSVHDINWLHSEGNYCMIYTSDKRFVIKTSMVRLKQRLPENLYIQVHRGYIVRLDRIDNVDLGRKIVLVGDNELPIGKKYRSDLINRISPI
ncbi:MAG: response regulator transcription factor [Bacteroidota bacterium]